MDVLRVHHIHVVVHELEVLHDRRPWVAARGRAKHAQLFQIVQREKPVEPVGVHDFSADAVVLLLLQAAVSRAAQAQQPQHVQNRLALPDHLLDVRRHLRRVAVLNHCALHAPLLPEALAARCLRDERTNGDLCFQALDHSLHVREFLDELLELTKVCRGAPRVGGLQRPRALAQHRGHGQHIEVADFGVELVVGVEWQDAHFPLGFSRLLFVTFLEQRLLDLHKRVLDPEDLVNQSLVRQR
mmetsp:Transcript_1/g.9  ORF Transcript_1/g.9 Transcript_1/m.9 type:complete len:242 (-) Transcript_1:855-1580(-)